MRRQGVAYSILQQAGRFATAPQLQIYMAAVIYTSMATVYNVGLP